MSLNSGMSGAQPATPKMYSWSYTLLNGKIALIQNMAVSIEDSRDMVAGELLKLKSDWVKGDFDEKRHKVRYLNLAPIPGFEPRTVNIQIVDAVDRMFLTEEIKRKEAKEKIPMKKTESPPVGPNGLLFFLFVYRESGSVSYNISVMASSTTAAIKTINDNISKYSNGTIKIQSPRDISLIANGIKMKLQYPSERIASVTRVTNLMPVTVFKYNGTVKFLKPQGQVMYKMSREQKKRYKRDQWTRDHPNEVYVPQVNRTAPVRDSTGAPVTKKVNAAKKKYRKAFNKFKKIATDDKVKDVTIEKWLAIKLMKKERDTSLSAGEKKNLLVFYKEHSMPGAKFITQAKELLAAAREGQVAPTPGSGAVSQIKGKGDRATVRSTVQGAKKEAMGNNEELFQVDADGSDGEFHVGGQEAYDVESEDEDIEGKYKV